ncbi:MAG: flavin reductase family protein [Candidatus Eiseniibacteriota bacterium]|nr:MAG: flavin reductase family protein [Candidatus Eisenbacteria bacterium]
MKKSIGAKTAIYPTPVLVIGTYDKTGKPNLATVAWGGVCCSRPPCVAVSLRKATYSHANIVARKAFTVNILSVARLAEADYYGMASGREENKFSRTGVTPVKSDLVDAPYGKEFPLVLECRLKHTVELGLHTQFVGEILDAKADEAVMGDNEYPDIEKLRPILYAPGSQKYYAVGECVGDAFSVGKSI